MESHKHVLISLLCESGIIHMDRVLFDWLAQQSKDRPSVDQGYIQDGCIQDQGYNWRKMVYIFLVFVKTYGCFGMLFYLAADDRGL